MNDEPNLSTPPARDDLPATNSTVPMWIFSLALILLFAGAVWFDHVGGWFDPQVYAPYHNAAELEAYQPVSGAEALRLQGKKTYETVCGVCHGPDGMGKPGQFPPLSGSEWVNARDFKRLAQIPLDGLNGTVHVKGQDWNASMAAMGAGLSDSDLAGVLTYIRSSWGNTGGEVTASDVKGVRATVGGKPAINGETQLKTIPE